MGSGRGWVGVGIGIQEKREEQRERERDTLDLLYCNCNLRYGVVISESLCIVTGAPKVVCSSCVIMISVNAAGVRCGVV